MNRRRCRAGALLLVAVSFCSFSVLADPLRGAWSEVIDWPIIPIHAGLLPDGRVFSFGGTNGLDEMHYSIWDPALGIGLDAHTELPLVYSGVRSFCSAMVLMPGSGEMIVAGGSEPDDILAGINNTHLLDYRDSDFTRPDVGMESPRWYPTLTTLADGRTLVQGGARLFDDSPGILEGVDPAITPEVFEDGEWRPLIGATSEEIYDIAFDQWWYPRSWVAPDGRVFGIAWDDMYYIDPNGIGSIEHAGRFLRSNRGPSSSAVMFAPGRILQIGGDQRRFSEPASKRAAIIDINGDTPVVTSAANMQFARHYANATVLPDGRVLVNGGTRIDEVAEESVLQVEVWDPTTNTWTLGASAAAPRIYHSTAMLLPDATVIAGGTTLGSVPRNLRKSMEIYRPDYLFEANGDDADRPSIVGGARGFSYGERFSVNVSAGDDVARVTLLGFGTVTHSNNMGQRFMELTFSRQGNTLNIDAPASPNLAPPGYYMLFALDSDGTPSEARFLKVDPLTPPTACDGLTREAEAGELRGVFAIGSDASASGGRFVHVPDGIGSIGFADPRHSVSYCFTVTEPGTYRLKASAYAADFRSNSFFVQVNGAPQEGYLWDTQRASSYVTQFVSNRNDVSAVELTLDAGEHTVTLIHREDGTRLDTLSLDPVIAEPTNCDGLTREAEDGDLTGPFVIDDDALASGGSYVHAPDGSGSTGDIVFSSKASYCFTVTEPGAYRLDAGIYAADFRSNSFFVQVDGAPNAGYLWDLPLDTAYGIHPLSERNGGPVVLILDTGEHTIDVFLREDGARLDRLTLRTIAEASGG